MLEPSAKLHGNAEWDACVLLRQRVKGKRHKDDPGRRTVLFLASAMRMTEAEVLEAGFKSKKLKCVPGFDKETHRADVIYFEYDREQAS